MTRTIFFLIHLGLGLLVVFQATALVRGTKGGIVPAPPRAGEGQGKGAQEESGQINGILPADVSHLMEKAIAERNLFKVLVDKNRGIQGSGKVSGPEKTGLNLTLWGTVVGETKESCWAVVEDLSLKTQDLYQPGETVGGARIKEILRNRIILTVNGEDQLLEASTAANPRPPEDPAPAEPTELQDDATSLEAPEDLFQTLKTRTYLKNGTPAGLLLYGIRPQSSARALGLRNGDILLAVDGSPVQTLEDFKGAVQGLDAGSALRMAVSRQGKEIEVLLNPTIPLPKAAKE